MRKHVLALLLLVGVPLLAWAVNLAWEASTSPEVTGYRLHHGTTSGTYTTSIDVGNVLTATIPDAQLAPAGTTNYIAATAYSPDAESGYSNEVIYTGAQAPQDGLVAAWGFPEGSGATSADQSGNTHTLTLQGATWTASGKTGNGLAFSGTGQYATTPHAADLSLGSTGTLEAWVSLAALNRWHGILSKGTANSNESHTYALEVTDANRPICAIGTGAAYNEAASSAALSLDTWYHLACVWNGATLALYVNGAQVASTAQTLTPVANSTPLSLGQFGNGFDLLHGQLDDVRIYNLALTGEQILTDMQTPVGAGSPPTGTVLLSVIANP